MPAPIDNPNTSPTASVVSVFPLDGNGGNPAPIVTDAANMTDADMQQTARDHALESGFVLPAEHPDADFRLRFFVPNHEMEMCGHATIAALWLLRARGQIAPGAYTAETLSGLVAARVPPAPEAIAVSQPKGEVTPLSAEAETAILDALGVDRSQCLAQPFVNARTSRAKTLIGLKSPELLHGLEPDFARIDGLCADIGSTGLYPFAVNPDEPNLYHARQFPRASGYPEDAATGIAATALAFGLWHYGLVDDPGAPIRIRQGEAMGRASEITVSFEFDSAADAPTMCWLSGICQILDNA